MTDGSIDGEAVQGEALHEGPFHGGAGRRAARRLGAALATWLVVATLVLVGDRPPAPLDLDAPPDVASGGRAMEILRRLARADGERVSPPRPVGTAANARCRERLVEECRRVGLFPEVDERFCVSTYQGAAGTTRNVIARLRGGAARTEPGSAILCMAHYDSVGAGPGIGDDLAAVAALLEVARALRAGEGTDRDVIFLFEDAEEHGLLGAEAFAQNHPWAADVGVVVNLEARGTTGPSMMFETGAGNAWAVEAWAGEVGRPSSTSVSVEVYRRMPNDTDYTVWRRRGVPGLNFAFIGDVTRYHTPIDDLEHLSPASLQHHASNALTAIRALDRATFPVDAGQERTHIGPDVAFFDVAGRTLVTMRLSTLRFLAALALVLALVGIGRAVAAHVVRGWRVVLAIPALVLALAIAALVARGESVLLGLLGAGTVPFPAHPTPTLVGLVAATLAGLTLASGVLRLAFRPAECGAALLAVLAFAGLALAWEVPGAAHLVVLPTLALGLAASLMRTASEGDERWVRAGVFGLGVATLLWTQLQFGVVGAFGTGSSLVVAAPLLVVWSFGLPALVGGWPFPSSWVTSIGLAVALVAAGVAGTRPAHSPDRPGRLNLVHVQPDEGDAAWQVMAMETPIRGRVLEALRDSLGGDARLASTRWIPWSWSPLFAAEARRIDAPPPELEIVGQEAREDGSVVVQAIARSPRGGDQLVLRVSGPATLRVDGVEVGAFRFAFLGPGEDPCPIEIEVGPDGVAEVEVFDKRFGLDRMLASRAEGFLEARPDTLVPSHDGDGSVLVSRFVLFRDDDGGVGVSRFRIVPDGDSSDGGRSE
ncbi:MAG: M20/M25/M40 family metallo-hydrolase [Planctomycetota bacterium]